jgi:23S rRNA (cytosine1962-C5)-methyltransferase
MEIVKTTLKENIKNTSHEYQRLFHGRGGIYPGFEDVIIDSINQVLLVSFYKEVGYEEQLVDYLLSLINTTTHTTLLIQKRYEKNAPFLILKGELPQDFFALENGLKFKLNIQNQNFGYFPDMNMGRVYIESIAKDKNILNLFSYTCGFSLSCVRGGAKMVTNVDMNKGVLSVGRGNHHLNNLSTNSVHFMPYNILKSFSRIKKYAPYDIIIIDPPSFQKGSFVATNDYVKIIKKLDLLSKKDTIVLACLNAPELDNNFLINLFKEHAPRFIFSKQIENDTQFPSLNPQKALKNLVFIKH